MLNYQRVIIANCCGKTQTRMDCERVVVSPSQISRCHGLISLIRGKIPNSIEPLKRPLSHPIILVAE